MYGCVCCVTCQTELLCNYNPVGGRDRETKKSKMTISLLSLSLSKKQRNLGTGKLAWKALVSPVSIEQRQQQQVAGLFELSNEAWTADHTITTGPSTQGQKRWAGELRENDVLLVVDLVSLS